MYKRAEEYLKLARLPNYTLAKVASTEQMIWIELIYRSHTMHISVCSHF